MKFIFDPSDLSELVEKSKSGTKIVIFGSGVIANKMYGWYIKDSALTVSYVVDNAPGKQGQTFHGIGIYPAGKLAEEDRARTAVMLLVHSCVDVYMQLKNMGFHDFYFADFSAQLRIREYNYRSIIAGPHNKWLAENNRLLAAVRAYYEATITYEIGLRENYAAFIAGSADYFKSPQFNALRIEDAEFDVFSQAGEDGVLQWILNRIDSKNKRFIEFGANDYWMSNTRFLYLAEGYDGLIIEGNEKTVEIIKTDPELSGPERGKLDIVAGFITKENINEIFKKHNYTGEIALLSVDIDGNDYWVWESIDCVSPQVVICEYNYALGGLDKARTIPYNPEFIFACDGYFGATYKALNMLAAKKGYSLIYVNAINIIYIRDDLRGLIGNTDLNEMTARVKSSYTAGGVSYWGGLLAKSANRNAAVVDFEKNATVNLDENSIY